MRPVVGCRTAGTVAARFVRRGETHQSCRRSTWIAGHDHTKFGPRTNTFDTDHYAVAQSIGE
jgi:hypothetical protein